MGYGQTIIRRRLRGNKIAGKEKKWKKIYRKMKKIEGQCIKKSKKFILKCGTFCKKEYDVWKYRKKIMIGGNTYRGKAVVINE